MDRQIASVRFLFAVLVCCLAWATPALAQTTGSVDLSQVTFNSMPAYQEAGDIASVGDLAVEMGYDPGRHWEAGDYPTDVFVLGDFQSSFGAQEMNLDQVSQLSGTNLNGLRIDEVPFLQNKSFSEVVDVVPALKDFTLEEVPAVAEVFGADSSMTIGKLIDSDELIGEMNFSKLFGEYAVTEIPNLDLTELSQFQNWQAMAISDVPGLGDIGFGALSQIPDVFSGVTATHDVTYGSKEHTKTRTKNSITGSNVDGFSVQCVQARGCAHIELTGAGNMHGAQWIAGGGKEGQQMVNGGEGILGAVNGGKEPTGRLPFGETVKVVLDKTNESEGTAEFALYFKYCYRGPPVDLGCTPYFLGPVPMPVLDSKEKGIVITGFLDALGGVTSALEMPKSWESLKPANSQEINDIVGKYAPSGKRRGGRRALCGEGYQGIDFEALSDAYKTIESNINGYNAVGNRTRSEDGTFESFGLGRYQFMSDRPDVRRLIREQPGGEEFLARTDSGQKPRGEELDLYFPPENQDALFTVDQKQLIDWAIEEGHIGSRIIEVIGQMHLGGTSPHIRDSTTIVDVNGKSVKDHGEGLWAAYSAIIEEKGSNSSCGKATGNFIDPTKGATRTSGFGWRFHPIHLENRFHGGLDFGAPTGAPVFSSDGGVVVFAGWNGGYGNTIEIDHGNGFTTLYAHLSAFFVKKGETVSQGDEIGAIGSTGNSTGPHLHFEIIDTGTGGKRRPEDYV